MADEVLTTYQYDSVPLGKFKILPNGNMHFVAPIARVTSATEKGLPYIDRQGNRYYQSVTLDVLTNSIDSFKGLSICLNHPIEKVGSSISQTKRLLTRGLTSTGRTFNTDSHIWMCGTNFDDELIKEITTGRTLQLSPAYEVQLRPTYQKEVFEQVQRKGDHLAFVPKGRNGNTVGLNLESADDTTSKESSSIFTFFGDINFDSSDYLQLLQSEFNQLPSVIQNLEEIYLPQSIDLDRFLVTKNQEDSSNENTSTKSTMKTYSIVDNKGSVITYQSDSDSTSEYIQYLSQQVEDTTSNVDSATASLAEFQAKITELEAKISDLTAQNETLKTSTTNQDSADQINQKATEIALSMFEILPSILQLDSSYDLGTMPKSKTELMRDYLILVNPAKKDQLSAMNLDSSIEGIRNSALIEGMYQVTKDLKSTHVAVTSKSEPNSMEALQQLLRGALITDSVDAVNQAKSRQAELIKSIDSNF